MSKFDAFADRLEDCIDHQDNTLAIGLSQHIHDGNYFVPNEMANIIWVSLDTLYIGIIESITKPHDQYICVEFKPKSQHGYKSLFMLHSISVCEDPESICYVFNCEATKRSICIMSIGDDITAIDDGGIIDHDFCMTTDDFYRVKSILNQYQKLLREALLTTMR